MRSDVIMCKMVQRARTSTDQIIPGCPSACPQHRECAKEAVQLRPLKDERSGRLAELLLPSRVCQASDVKAVSRLDLHALRSSRRIWRQSCGRVLRSAGVCRPKRQWEAHRGVVFTLSSSSAAMAEDDLPEKIWQA